MVGRVHRRAWGLQGARYRGRDHPLGCHSPAPQDPQGAPQGGVHRCVAPCPRQLFRGPRRSARIPPPYRGQCVRVLLYPVLPYLTLDVNADNSLLFSYPSHLSLLAVCRFLSNLFHYSSVHRRDMWLPEACTDRHLAGSSKIFAWVCFWVCKTALLSWLPPT